MKNGEIWEEVVEDSDYVSPIVIEAVRSDIVYFWLLSAEDKLEGYLGEYEMPNVGDGGVPFELNREEFLRVYRKRW